MKILKKLLVTRNWARSALYGARTQGELRILEEKLTVFRQNNIDIKHLILGKKRKGKEDLATKSTQDGTKKPGNSRTHAIAVVWSRKEGFHRVPRVYFYRSVPWEGTKGFGEAILQGP